MTEPSARVIADSISPWGHRVTSVEAVFNRFVLAEVNTHRVFSRNSASSRAIPLARQLDKVTNDPAMPSVWPLEQPGMSGGDELPPTPRLVAERYWLRARTAAVEAAEELGRQGVHKSVANRLLEPFMWHTAVITSTAWDNFFGLRVSPAAQPEFKRVAEAIKEAMDASTPNELLPIQWHLPYITAEDVHAVEEHLFNTARITSRVEVTKGLIRVSTSRVASVSYVRQGEPREIEKDFNLYDRLTSADPMHASPLEHVCTPNPMNEHAVEVTNQFNGRTKTLTLPHYGNLLGWHQHRFDVEIDRDYQAFA